MQIKEKISHKGFGVWGYHKFDLMLIEVVSELTAFWGRQSKTTRQFLMCFKKNNESSWDTRSFDSEEARRKFLHISFSQLILDEVSIDQQKETIREYCLNVLLGELFTSVTFGMDWIELNFEEHSLRLNYTVNIIRQNETIQLHDKGFKEMLCDLVGSTVLSVEEYLDAGILIELDLGDYISIPLNVFGECPEIVIYTGSDINQMIVWQVGEHGE